MIVERNNRLDENNEEILGIYDLTKAIMYSGDQESGVYYNSGRSGVDMGFLEYGLEYSYVSPEDINIMDYLGRQTFKDLMTTNEGGDIVEGDFISENIKTIPDILIPTSTSDSNEDWEESDFRPSWFGSYSFETQVTYVVMAGPGVDKVELYDSKGLALTARLGVSEIPDDPDIDGRLVAEIAFSKVIFLSTYQESEGSGNSKISYHAWTKLINPVRKKKDKSMFKSEYVEPSQFSNPLPGYYRDEASGSILGNVSESNFDRYPLYRRRRAVADLTRNQYSPWKSYSKGETTTVVEKHRDGTSTTREYESLVSGNIGNSPAISKKWICKDKLTDYYTYKVYLKLISDNTAASESDLGRVNPEVINIFPWTEQISFIVTPNVEDGFDLNISDDAPDISFRGEEIGGKTYVHRPHQDVRQYIVTRTLPDNYRLIGDKILDINITSASFTTLNTRHSKVHADGTWTDPNTYGSYTIQTNSTDPAEFGEKYVSIPWGELRASSSISLSGRMRTIMSRLKATITIGEERIETKTRLKNNKLEVSLGDNPNKFLLGKLVKIEFTEIKYTVFIANSGDFMISNISSQVTHGDNLEIEFKPYPGLDISGGLRFWINKEVDDQNQPVFITPSGGVIKEGDGQNHENAISITQVSAGIWQLNISNITKDIGIDIVV